MEHGHGRDPNGNGVASGEDELIDLEDFPSELLTEAMARAEGMELFDSAANSPEKPTVSVHDQPHHAAQMASTSTLASSSSSSSSSTAATVTTSVTSATTTSSARPDPAVTMAPDVKDPSLIPQPTTTNETTATRPRPTVSPATILPAIPKRGLVWFRRDLRIHDNLALHAALQHTDMELILMYIIHRPKIMLCGVNRFQFLIESVACLAEAISARGSRLVIARGDGLEVLQKVIPAWNITHLFFDEVTEPFACQRDDKVKQFCNEINVQVETTHGCTLYDLDLVIEKHHGRAPKTYSSFLKTITLMPLPPPPIEPPTSLPPPEVLCSGLYEQLVEHWKDRCEEDEAFRNQLEIIAGPEKVFTIPEVTEFGFDQMERHSFIYGGETIALGILNEYCRNEGRVVTFEKPKTSPAETCPSSSTTSLSPYLYFGCISPRKFFHHVREIQEKYNKKHVSLPPVSLDGQLLWREFFHCNGRANPYFDKMEENPLCLMIDWRLHNMDVDPSERSDDEKLAAAQFEAWKEGHTGFPWIDAIMRQLREEGWMHHLARHSVACFLTRGDLYISWVRGLEVFQERLIDHDWCINAGNWLWLSASAFFSAYFRVYSPSTFGKKWDPEGKYIKKYIPELKKMPMKYIYEPWKAPVTVQRAAGCLIGKDYPFPIVDHKIALKKCMAGMKASYAKREYGVSPLEAPKSPHKRQREDMRSDISSSSSEDSSTATGYSYAEL